jgi:hypothetical protein
MILTKHTFILLASLCLLSANCRTKGKQANKNSTVRTDTTPLVKFLKSYEPKSYKGRIPQQFYTNRGSFDWWRFPLIYPYSIGCIDVTEYGAIYSDEGRTNYEGGSRYPLTSCFDKLILDKNYLVGTRFKDPFSNDTTNYSEQYYIFSFHDGTTKNVIGKQNLEKELRDIKFSGDTTFMKIKEYGNRL